MEISIFTLAALIVLFVLFYKYCRQNEHYFHDKPIPYLVPHFIFGNTLELFRKRLSMTDFLMKLYNVFPEARIVGLFDLKNPAFLLRDPEVVKHICIKDFDYFTDHRTGLAEAVEHSDDIFASSLVAMKGQKWRDMRATMSPAFTGSKMRLMFEMVSEVAVHMTEYFSKQGEDGKIILEMKQTFQKYGLDVIASTAFGLNIDSFNEEETSFYKMGQKVVDFNNFKTVLKFFAFRAFPNLCVKLNVELLDKEVTNYFMVMVTDTMNRRETEGIVRPDLINILMQLRTGNLQHNETEDDNSVEGFATVEESQLGKEKVNRKWTDRQLVAQAFIFFLAGFDTTSTCLQFLSYALMVNEDVQLKLYDEVKETEKSLPNGRLTYEALQKMKYLDAVVCEVLRFWAPLPNTDRLCIKDYLYDDGAGCKFKIEKGNTVWIPIHAFHHDARYFTNPEKFDPERFCDERKHEINLATYLPFGVGPRNCIGSRFALMHVKIIIYYLLLKFSFEKTEKSQIPVQLMKGGFTMRTEKGVWVELKPRN